MATKTAFERWHARPWAYRWFAGCIGKLLGIPASDLKGTWIPRFDQDGNIYMLLRREVSVDPNYESPLKEVPNG